MVLGGLDRAIGNKFGLGEKFEEGFNAMGPLALSMVGVYALSPVLAKILGPIVTPVYKLFGADPAMFAGTLLANDMGGWPLAQAMTDNPDAQRLSGLILGAMMGATVVFTIPFWYRFGGALRNGPDDKWMPMVAYQQSFVSPPARLFRVEGSMLGVPFDAYHRYVGPMATFQVRAASLVTMVDAHGAEMNHSETVTLFNDMFLLAPATLIDSQITWEELDPLMVRATWTNAGNTVSAVVSFDSSGALTNFVSDDRSRTVDGKHYERLRWSTPVSDWHDVDGRKLFGSGDAAWELDGKEFAYARFEMLDVEYNVTQG